LPLLQAGHSQKVRLNLYGNYVFDDQVDNSLSYNTEGFYSGTLKGGFLWGAGIEYRFHDYYGLELFTTGLILMLPLNIGITTLPSII
jgi:hypothetical protein